MHGVTMKFIEAKHFKVFTEPSDVVTLECLHRPRDVNLLFREVSSFSYIFGWLALCCVVLGT